MIKKNNQTIDKIYKGTTEIAKIYKGSTLVYENYRDIIATGNDIINITKAKANSLNYLKAFGKCEQRRLPVGYQQVEYIESTGTQWIDTGLKMYNNSEIELCFSFDNIPENCSIFGSRLSGTTNNFEIASSLPNFPLYLDFGSYYTSRASYNNAVINTKYICTISKSLRAIYDENRTLLTRNTNLISADNVTPYNARIFDTVGGFSANKLKGKVYYCKIWENGVLVRNMIPCKNPSNVVGMYDTVNKVFYTNAGTGTFTAGAEIVPTPSTPIPIWCNNGELKVSPNLFDKNNLNYIAGYLTVNGNKIESSSKTDTYYIECNPNTTYTLQREKVKTSGQVFRFASYSEVPTYNNQFTGMVGGLTDDLTLTITTGANDKYLAFSIGNVLHSDTEYIDKVQIEQGSTATQYRPYRQIHTDGTTETIKDSLNNTATAENLLSAGIYKDVQEVISGSVTRNVGIKVLNGTENWQYHSYGTNSYQLVFNLTAIPQDKVITCSTHFKSYSYDNRTNPETNMLYLHPSAGIILRNSTFPTVDDFKQWLADQYANGTPVIVVYPLATPTTETVTAQPMNIQKGTNIIEVAEASLNDLELEAKYKGK